MPNPNPLNPSGVPATMAGTGLPSMATNLTPGATGVPPDITLEPIHPTVLPTGAPSNLQGVPEGVTLESPSSGEENGIQREYDKLIQPMPFMDTKHGSPADYINDVVSIIPNQMSNIGAGVLSLASPLFHPIATAKFLTPQNSNERYLSSIGLGVPGAIHLGEGLYEGVKPKEGEGVGGYLNRQGGNLEALFGMGLGGRLAGEVAPYVAKPLGNFAKRGAVGLINKTVGAKTAGELPELTPGAGYFQGKIGPSLTLNRLAKAAEAAKQSTGVSIGNAVDTATAAGRTIPYADVSNRVWGPINEASDVLNGPFGPGDAAIRSRVAGFPPEFRSSALPQGTDSPFTPRAIQDLKENVSSNVGWTDPTQVGVKQVGQQIAGGLSDPMRRAVPELNELYPTYQNTSDLEQAAIAKANRGNPFTSLRRATELFGGGGAGLLSGHLGAGMLPLILDELQGATPIRTAGASALHGIGNMLSPETGVAGETLNPLPPYPTTPPIIPPISTGGPYSGMPPASTPPVGGPSYMGSPVIYNESPSPVSDFLKSEQGGIKTPEWMKRLFDAWRISGRPENLTEGLTPLDQAIMDQHTGYGRTPELMKPKPPSLDWMDKMFIRLGDPSNNYTLGEKGGLTPLPSIGGKAPRVPETFQPFTHPGAPRFTESGEPRMGIPRDVLEFPKPVNVPSRPVSPGLPPISDITPVSKTPNVMDRLKGFMKNEEGGVKFPEGMTQAAKDSRFSNETKVWSDTLKDLMNEKQRAQVLFNKAQSNPNADPNTISKAQQAWQRAESAFNEVHDKNWPGPERSQYASPEENNEVELLGQAVDKMRAATKPEDIAAAKQRVADIQLFLDRRFPLWAHGRVPFWLNSPGTPRATPRTLPQMLDLLGKKEE